MEIGAYEKDLIRVYLNVFLETDINNSSLKTTAPVYRNSFFLKKNIANVWALCLTKAQYFQYVSK